MHQRRTNAARPDKVECLLIGSVFAMVLAAAILPRISPHIWACVLQIADPRYWSVRDWIVAIALLLYALCMIRFWPGRIKPSEKELEARPSKLITFVAWCILLAAVGSVLYSLVPWAEMHPLRWYMVRIVYYWTRYRWCQAGPLVLFAGVLAVLLWIRARSQSHAIDDVRNQEHTRRHEA